MNKQIFLLLCSLFMAFNSFAISGTTNGPDSVPSQNGHFSIEEYKAIMQALAYEDNGTRKTVKAKTVKAITAKVNTANINSTRVVSKDVRPLGPLIPLVDESIMNPADSTPNCKEVFTNIPPFYISNTTNKTDKLKKGKIYDKSSKNITTENFRNKAGVAVKRISRGSIVAVTGDDRLELENLIRNPKSKGFRVPVKVKSANDTYKGFHAETGKFVKKDDEGYIWSKSLKPAKSEQAFVLTEDTLLSPGANDTNLKGKGLQPVTNTKGEFKTQSCCQKTLQDLPAECNSTYFYKVMGSSGESKLNGTIVKINHACFTKGLRPLEKVDFTEFDTLVNFMGDKYGKKFNLADMDFNDYGSIRLPLESEVNTSKPVAGKGIGKKFVYYKNFDQAKSDNWGKPSTICSLYNLTDKFYDACIKVKGRSEADCQARVGDIGHVTPGKKSNKKDLLGHKSHSNGTCIDFRPFRDDESYAGTVVNGKGYSREINQEFIKMAKDMGASPVYLNDILIPESSYMSEHSDHIHLCFPPSSKRVQDSCLDRKIPLRMPHSRRKPATK